MKKQRGAALMVILVILGVVGAYFALKAFNSGQTSRDRETANTLAQAKESLIGYAATYRDFHADEVFGYLPCPDMNNSSTTPGEADALDADCGGKDISAVKRLPWKTLGLPPLRDSGGECLWYAVSGHAKANTTKTDVFNWDTIGQFIVRDADGNPLAGYPLADASAHARPLAVILAPRAAIGSQDRTALPGPATECGGNNTISAYLDGDPVTIDPIYAGTVPGSNATTTLSLSTSSSASLGTNNDQGIWITAKDIFDRVKQRKDFQDDINGMLDHLEQCIRSIGIPDASTTNKGIDNLLLSSTCKPIATKDQNVLKNWQDNLLYSKPGALSGKSCDAVLIFAGERTTNQLRPDTICPLTPPNPPNSNCRNIPANYLENANVTSFGVPGAVPGAPFDMPSGAGSYSPKFSSRDVIRCITATPPTTKSFANNFGNFTAVGTGVTPNATDKTLNITDAPGTTGGCFWSDSSVPLAGKTLRAYYEFNFSKPDSFALTGAGTDRGNGFSLQMMRSDFAAPPTGCGAESNMGALTAGAPFGFDPNGTNSLFGQRSFIFETDVHRAAGHNDSVENHTAIMLNGNLNHALTGPLSTACDGSAIGCRHNPANKFEESPSPQPHNQRIEIHTGCNASCTACNPASHVAPNTFARISAWIDCADCSDVVTDYLGSNLLGSEQIAALQNRDFSAPGNWTGTNWSLSAGTYSHTLGANAITLPNAALTSPPLIGTTYRVAVKVITATPGTITIAFGGASTAPITLTTPGTTIQTIQLQALSTGDLTLIPDANWSGSIDDFSITISSLGNEQIAAPQNRDFSAPGSWTGSNWSLAAGTYSHTPGANAATLPNSALTNPPAVGSIYRVAVKVMTSTPGAVTIAFGGVSAAPIALTAPGTTFHTIQFKATSTANLTLTPDANWSGTIDDISISIGKTPTVERCTALFPELNSFYFGFTGGFRSGAAQQGATLRNFILRSE